MVLVPEPEPGLVLVLRPLLRVPEQGLVRGQRVLQPQEQGLVQELPLQVEWVQVVRVLALRQQAPEPVHRALGLPLLSLFQQASFRPF